jgi:hypothetical protein
MWALSLFFFFVVIYVRHMLPVTVPCVPVLSKTIYKNSVSALHRTPVRLHMS